VRLSVVIPTRDRVARLTRTLGALDRQTNDVAGGVEIVVVDDGSTDETREFLSQREGEGRLQAIVAGPGGPARARNAGARAARGDVLLFLGDDIVPEAGFLAAHDAAQREAGAEGRAVLGHTGWDASRQRVTPMLRHLGQKGLQFGYSLIRDPENVPPWFFYASNVSLPRELFLGFGGFDETFGGAAWEDVEFAFRAARAPRPLRLVYRPSARALHDHPTTVASFRARQRASGRGAAILAKRRPDLEAALGVAEARSLGATRPAYLRGAEFLIGLVDPLGVPLPGRIYDKLFRWDYLAGLREALEEVPNTPRPAPPSEAEGLHLSA
jgi:glycosyltransferase involved in cell wall biosynthesis